MVSIRIKKDSKMNYLENLMNDKPLEEFVEFINSRLRTSNEAWREIANAFAEAREMYGSESNSFKQLLKETKFSQNTAHKLATIASSERLSKYKSKLLAVHSWSTLYAIHALSDELFNKLKEKFNFDDGKELASFITFGDIKKLKSVPTQKSSYKTFTTIQINIDALRGHEMDGHDIARLKDLIEQIEQTVPYVKVISTAIDDKAESDYMKKVEKYKESITRSKIRIAIDSILERHPHIKNARNKYKVMFGYSNKSDIIQNALGDVDTFFGQFGFDCNSGQIYDEAIEKANTWCQKFAKKVVQNDSPFNNANNALQANSSQSTI